MPITAGVIDLAAVPPPNQLVKSITSPSALTNPHSGSGLLVASSGGIQAFGLRWEAVVAPPEAGQSARSVLIYAEQYLSFSVHYLLADGGDFIGESILSGAEEGCHLFQTAQADSVAYEILPGWYVHLEWLVQP